MAEENSKIEAQSSYRSIFKATTLFGGVQIIQILVAVIRSKVVAVLLGPMGVGILGLYQSAITMVQSVTSMGLSTSAVRDVSEASGQGNLESVSRIVIIVRRLVWFTGLLGTIVVLVLSPILSKITFGNYDYVIPFILLSVVMLFDQLSAGQKVVLQGLRKLRDLAKASVWGSVIGLLLTIPLYFLLGIEGIVPTLILNSIVSLFFSWLFSKKIKINQIHISAKQTLNGGATMLKMGQAISLSGMLVYASSYFLRGFIRIEDGTEAVGVFTAGFTILASYVGMVFNAMSTDYYPRLAESSKDRNKTIEIVNKQGEIASLIIGPLLVAFLLFMQIIVNILYSNSFLHACDYLYWAIIGMMFKLGSWVLAYQIVARGDMKLFIINEVAVNTYSFIFSIIGYRLGGLEGLGIAFSLGYFLYSIQMYFVTKKVYEFELKGSFLKIYVTETLSVLLCMLLICTIPSLIVRYCLGITILLASIMWSVKELNNRLDLLSYLKK